jgi:endo-1,4-beta-xylanase
MTMAMLAAGLVAAGAPAVGEDAAFERLAWDFEDGTSQGWFGRNEADGFGVVTPGADSSYAIGVWDRTDQGSGPMVEIDQMVRPGQRLAFSADVRFTESVSDDVVTLSIQTGPSSFSNLITNMAVDADGAWTRIEGVFVVPAFTTMARLYLESPWAGGARGETAAFQVDNVVIDVPAPVAWDRELVPFRETLPGINAGVAVDSRDLVDEMAEVIAHHFSHLVGENHMKPDAWWTADPGAGTAWSAGIDSFRIHPEARSILDFAQEHGMTVHGHVLVWHGQTPAWFFSYEDSAQEMAPTAANQQEMVRRIWEYVGIVAGGIAAEYGPFGSDTNPVHSFEVANEVVHGGGGGSDATHNLRPDSPWTRIFAPVADSSWVAERGFDNRDWFLYEAFQAAEHSFNFVHHVGDARGRLNGREDRVTLWINDYNTERGLIEPANPRTKRYQLLQVVNRLLEAGAPLDGVGHQFHAGLTFPYEGLRLALDLFAHHNGYVADRVLQAVTEIDVTIPSNSEANLVAQGRYYREAFDIIRTHHIEHGDIATVTLWGLNDGRSWRGSQYPLLFDDDLSAKPAFFGAVYDAHVLDADIWDRWERPALPTVGP